MNVFELWNQNGNVLLLNLLLQITLFCAVVLLIAGRFKNSAALRYGMLYPAMLSLFVLSAVSIASQSSQKSLIYFPVLEEFESLALNFPLSIPDFVFDESLANAAEVQAQIDGQAQPLPATPSAQTSIASPTSGNAALQVNSLWTLILKLPPSLFLSFIWVGGFLFLTFGLLRSFHHVEKVTRSSRQLSPQNRSTLNEVMADRFPEYNQIHYRVSAKVESPILVGLFSPVILLPEKFVEQLSNSQLRNVLLHEYAHFERRDALANFLQKVCLAVFWFHPLVHVMDKRISRAREEICDNYVLSQDKAVNYGQTLLQVSEISNRAHHDGAPNQSLSLGIGMFGGDWKLEQRISELLSDKRNTATKLKANTSRWLQLGFAAFAFSLAACQVGAADASAGNADQSQTDQSTTSQSASNSSSQSQTNTSNNQSNDELRDSATIAQASDDAVSEAREVERVAREIEIEVEVEQEREAREIAEVEARLEQELERERQDLREARADLEAQAASLQDQAEDLLEMEQELQERSLLMRQQAARMELTLVEKQQRLEQDTQELRTRLNEKDFEQAFDGARQELERSIEDVKRRLEQEFNNADNEEIALQTRHYLEQALVQLEVVEEELMMQARFELEQFLSSLEAIDTQELERRARQAIEEVVEQMEGLNQQSEEELVERLQQILGQLDTNDAAQPSNPNPRAAPPGSPETELDASQQQVLSPNVNAAIAEIQNLMSPEDEEADPDYAAAKVLLDELYESRFERMNDFEKQITLNFYTNYHLSQQDYDQALRNFEQILAIENLRMNTRLRTLRSLGQLYAAEEYWNASISSYEKWQAVSEEEDPLVYKGLSYGNYQLENFEEALVHWERYFAMIRELSTEIERDDYLFLNGLYFMLKDFDSAQELTREMIELFNNDTDKQNLIKIEEELSARVNAGPIIIIKPSEPRLTLASQETAQDDPTIVNPSGGLGDYLPMTTVAPQYPTRAARSGVEGWALVSFTVDAQGNVVADSLQVVDAEPPDVFDRASMRAAREFKFEPRQVNGIATAVPGVQYLFRFKLSSDA